jgi:citrate lyase subunit beta/citryl-CoA lyase
MMNAERERAPVALRSLLFVPGNHARRVEKALGSTADAVILDLEDAVAVGEKGAARVLVAGAVAAKSSTRTYVRVNGLDTPWCYQDLLAVVIPGLAGVVVPKVACAADLLTLDWLLTQLERERGLPMGGIELLPLIETAVAILRLEEIAAASRRVRCLAFGGADYALDLRLQPTVGEEELAFARARLVHCSRAANLEAPIDSVTLEFRDGERIAIAAHRSRQLGFQGKLCIHPDQIATTHAAFSPSAEEIVRARAIVQAFETAEAAGAAAIQLDGVMIDYPVAAKARQILALSARIAAAH